MKIRVRSMQRLLFVLALAPLLAQETSEVTVRRARNWSPNAADGWCAVKVWVDDEAEFALQGDKLVLFTARGRAARDVATECSGPLPANVENFRFKGVDGRGEVTLIEQPSRYRSRAVVRIRDNKPDGEEYHFRLEWSRGAFKDSAAGGGSGTGGSSNSGGSVGTNFGDTRDITRWRTRDLRQEIERLYSDATRRRATADEVDEYIDKVRFDRWTFRDIQREIERRR